MFTAKKLAVIGAVKFIRNIPIDMVSQVQKNLYGVHHITVLFVNDTLGEPGHTPLYVGLPSAWGSVDGDLMFFPIRRRAPFWGLQQTYMNE